MQQQYYYLAKRLLLLVRREWEKYIEKELIVLTMKLDLTPEQEKLVEEALIVNDQTLEELLMSAVYTMNNNKGSKLPKIVRSSGDIFVRVSVNEGGAIVIPEDAPQGIERLGRR